MEKEENFFHRWILDEDQPDSPESQKGRKLITKYIFCVCRSFFIYGLCRRRQLTQWRHQIRIIIFIIPIIFVPGLASSPPLPLQPPPPQKLLFNFCFRFARDQDRPSVRPLARCGVQCTQRLMACDGAKTGEMEKWNAPNERERNVYTSCDISLVAMTATVAAA